MSLRFIDWIWHVRGDVALASGQSVDEAFARLDPLFQQAGTTRERTDDTLTFRKKDPAAQDKMSIFESGHLRIERDAAGSVLRYDLISRALLFCFLAPLLFLAIAQLTIVVGKLDKPSADATAKATHAKKALAAKKAEVPMNPIDKALGAPAPDKPGKDSKTKDKDDDDDKPPSPTAAYVFAGIFAALYVAGRVLEAVLIRRLFIRRLQTAPADRPTTSTVHV